MLTIYVDADACPVKDEVYKVADRYKLNVFLVSNQYINIPFNPRIQIQVVDGGFDAADDWIVEQIEKGDIVITSDILLSDRCIKKSSRVLNPKGHELNDGNIGSALAGRELAEHLRDLGHKKTGPSAMSKTDRSNFLAKLDQIIQSIKKKGA
jgi:uncharacterized protein